MDPSAASGVITAEGKEQLPLEVVSDDFQVCDFAATMQNDL